MRLRLFRLALFALPAAVLLLSSGTAGATPGPSFLNRLVAGPMLSASTVPANGDQNPYGVAIVPYGFPADGTAHAGDILVSNFNNKGNLQGTGTTIVAGMPSARAVHAIPWAMLPALAVRLVRQTGLTTALFTAPLWPSRVARSWPVCARASGQPVGGRTPDGAQPDHNVLKLVVSRRHRCLLFSCPDRVGE